MLTGRADRKRARKKLLCALLAALLLTCIGACAETAEGPDLDLINPDLILAQDTVDYLELTAPEGGRLTVRSDPSVPGRGEADPEGNEPDYSGVLGFAALPNDPEIGSSSIFCTPSWQVPVYRRSKDGKTMVKGGSLAHKTPVLVIRQKQSPDPKNLTVQGIVFTGNESGSAAPEILYFRETDLTVLY